MKQSQTFSSTNKNNENQNPKSNDNIAESYKITDTKETKETKDSKN